MADRAENVAEFIRRLVITTRAVGDPTTVFVDSALLKIGASSINIGGAIEARELMANADSQTGQAMYVGEVAPKRTSGKYPVMQATVDKQVRHHRPMANEPNSRHVVPSEGGGWDVKKPGSDRASRHFETQKEAIDKGRQILKNDGGGELNIHGRDGKIRDKDTIPPGNDPYPPKG